MTQWFASLVSNHRLSPLYVGLIPTSDSAEGLS